MKRKSFSCLHLFASLRFSRYFGSKPLFRLYGRLLPRLTFVRKLCFTPCLQGSGGIPPTRCAIGTRLAYQSRVVQLILKITARPKGIPGMVQALAGVMFQARVEPGYVDCELYAEVGDPQSLRYVEEWATPQDMESQICSHRFGTLLAIMETAPQAPSLEVRTVSEQRGLDFIETLRLGSRHHAPRTGGCTTE